MWYYENDLRIKRKWVIFFISLTIFTIIPVTANLKKMLL